MTIRPTALALAVLLAPAAWAAAPFHDNGDGTVADSSTGLMWDQCHLGQGSPGCGGAAGATYTWQEALQAVQALNAQPGGYKGHGDWRLPNIKELLSLVAVGAADPAVDTEAFPGASSGAFWSSTYYLHGPFDSAWRVQFQYGVSETAYLGSDNLVRLVRDDTSAPPVTVEPVVTTPGSDGTSVTASVVVDEDGTGYWLVLPATEPAPDAATVLGSSATLPLTAGTPATITLGGLTPGTRYVLYFIARDADGNAQASPSATPFTTPAATSAATSAERPAVQAVPTLGEWTLALLAALTAVLGLRRPSLRKS